MWRYETCGGGVRIVGCEPEGRVVEVPGEIDGLPVVAIAPDALASSPGVEEIVCSDGIVEIGNCAFRRNPDLKRVVFPARCASFQANWLRECPQVEEVVLPGALEAIDAGVFELKSLKRLVIGPSAREVKPGAFERSRLESIEVAPGNPHLMTDGEALYTADGRVLVALACPVERYEVRDGCEAVGRKAFHGAKSLLAVELPESVRVLEPFAFAHSGLREFDAPGALEEIGEKAFLHCGDLARASLNAGLRSIGDEAFATTALHALSVPASVEHIGREATRRSNVTYSGADATFAVDPASRFYLVDGEGGLYRKDAEGLVLVEALDRDVRSYRVALGTASIAPRAFAHHEHIEEVAIPHGVTEVGDGAFRNCGRLRRAVFPDTLRAIGKEAFVDTSLERLDIPASLERIGENALVTVGAHHEGPPPSLRDVRVDAGNARFFTASGMLCERIEGGTRIVLFTNSERRVAFPDDTVEVAPYAFNNAFGIEDLHLNAGLRLIGACGLGVWCWIRHIRIDVAEPIEGRETFDLYFPETARSIHGFLVAVGMSSEIFMPAVMAQYDNCIATARNYRAPDDPENIGAYEQAQLVIDRLAEPVLLSRESRERYENLVRANIADICVDIARHDDREAIDKLLELGYLNEDNLPGVIDAVRVVQDAAMTGYLLEVKRQRFGGSAMDFEL